MTATNCHPTILTASGHHFDFEDPEGSVFVIEDIAHALSHVCRFAGHTQIFYSVAQHSVFVSRLVPEEYALQGLLHDAAEAFLGDVTKPLKNLLPDYMAIEARIEKAVLARFGLSPELHPSVKKADLMMVATEKRDLMAPSDELWAILEGVEMMPKRIVPYPPNLAYMDFMYRWEELNGL